MIDPMTALLGLGVAGDAFGAYSQYSAAKRQRDIFNQYNQQRQLMQNPAYQISQAQPYYQAELSQLRQQLPAFMRSTVNPMLAIQGLDPAGGQGRFITEQAIAPQIGQAWRNALGTVQGQNTAAMSALGGMTTNVGQPSGQMGGTANALQSMMLMQALGKYRGGDTTDTTGLADTSGLSGGMNPSMSGVNLRGGYGGGQQLQFGASPYQQSYFPDMSLTGSFQ